MACEPGIITQKQEKGAQPPAYFECDFHSVKKESWHREFDKSKSDLHFLCFR